MFFFRPPPPPPPLTASPEAAAFLAHTSWVCFAFGVLLCLVCPRLDSLFHANVPTIEAQLFVRHFGLAMLLVGALCLQLQAAQAELAPLLLVWHGVVVAAFAVEIFILRAWHSAPLHTRVIAVGGALLHAAVLGEGLYDYGASIAHTLPSALDALPSALDALRAGGRRLAAGFVNIEVWSATSWWFAWLIASSLAWPLLRATRWMRRRESLSGHLVVVTGAAGGIGRELALEFLRAGARLALWDVREEGLEEVHRMLTQSGYLRSGDVIHTSCVDISDPAAVTAAATALRHTAGVARVVVSNAAVMRGSALLDATDAEIRTDLQVNALGSFWCVRAFLRQMLSEPSPQGVMVTMGSIMAELPAARQAEYCASKAAVGQMHECLRWELRARPDARDIRSLLVLPYAVRTPMLDGAALLGEGSEPCHRRFAWIGLLLPPLRPEAVAQRVVRAVQAGEERVYIPWVIGWIPAALNLLPAPMRDVVLAACGAVDGAHGFRGCAPPRV